MNAENVKENINVFPHSVEIGGHNRTTVLPLLAPIPTF